MENKWNNTRYFVTEVAQKLCCDPVDIIQYGTLNKLRIAAFINIEMEKVRTHFISEMAYNYSSGIYYVNNNKLLHFEFVERIDDFESSDIITINAYKDDHNQFYSFNGSKVFDFDNSMFSNIDEKIEYDVENFDGYIPEYENDSDYEANYENDLSLLYNDYSENTDDEMTNTSEASVYYTIYRKDLLILHNDLVRFFKNEEQFHNELNIIKGDNIIMESKIVSTEKNQKESIQVSAIKKGGRPKDTLREAIEHAYIKLRDEGNKEILRPGNPREFLLRLKEMATEGNPNEDQYIVERIKLVKIPNNGECSVVTQDQIICKKTTEMRVKSRPFPQSRISQILSELRKI